MARSRDSGSSSADRAHGVGAGAPVGAALPVLLLPDRDRLLQRVDAEARGLEGLGAVRRRHDDRHRRRRRASRSPMRCSSATRSIIGHCRRASAATAARRGDRLFLVGLVGEARARRRGPRRGRARHRGTPRPRHCAAWWPTQWRRRPAGARRRRRSSRRKRAGARRHGSEGGVASALRPPSQRRRVHTPDTAGRPELRRRGMSQTVGTLRAMSPEESGGDGAPEPDDAPSGPPPTRSTAPGCTPASCARSSARPPHPPASPGPGSG